MSLNLLLFFEIAILLLLMLALFKFNRKQFSSDLLFVFLEEENRNQLKINNLENTRYQKIKIILIFQALSIVILFASFTYIILTNHSGNEIKLLFVILLLLNRYVWNSFVKKILN